MRRLIIFVVITLFVVPLFVFAQGLVPLVPTPCSGSNNDANCISNSNPITGQAVNGYGSCEFANLINNVIQFIVSISALLAVIVFIYAGFLMVTSRGDEGQLTKAKGMFTNVVIGLIILLAAFVIVNTIMSALLKPGSGALNWQSVQCTYPTTASVPSKDTSVSIDGGGGGGGGGVGSGGRGSAQCAPENTNCSVSMLQSLGLSQTQANVMSCIAVTENSGGSVGCSGTGPCGTFQISRTDWRRYSSQISGCSATDFGGNLTSAQNNGPCNARVMTAMVRSSRGYQPWTGANNGVPWNPNARTCVQNYSGSGDSTNRGF